MGKGDASTSLPFDYGLGCTELRREARSGSGWPRTGCPVSTRGRAVRNRVTHDRVVPFGNERNLRGSGRECARGGYLLGSANAVARRCSNAIGVPKKVWQLSPHVRSDDASQDPAYLLGAIGVQDTGWRVEHGQDLWETGMSVLEGDEIPANMLDKQQICARSQEIMICFSNVGPVAY